MSRKTVVFDFDGVIHKYSKGWFDGSIYDEPVEGIDNVFKELKEKGWDIKILSTRSKEPTGKSDMQNWLHKYNLDIYISDICDTKPLAKVFVDDRAICFTGDCNGLADQIDNFKPWNK